MKAFQEYPKWINIGDGVIVWSKEEEDQLTQRKPEETADSAPAPKKRGRPRKVVTDGNGSDQD